MICAVRLYGVRMVVVRFNWVRLELVDSGDIDRVLAADGIHAEASAEVRTQIKLHAGTHYRTFPDSGGDRSCSR